MAEYKWLIEMLFGGLGTAIIGYIFFKKYKHHRLIQKQKSGTNSTNIQAGRDIKINNKGNIVNKNNQEQRSGNSSTNVQAGGNVTIMGVTYNEARQIADDLFKANFLTLQGEARNIAQQRAEELINEFLTALQTEKTVNIDVVKDPDMQHALFTAQRDYARSGSTDLSKLLVDILVERAKLGNDELKKIVLNEAIQVAPKLTKKQLNAISIRFLIASSRNPQVNNLEKFNNYLLSQILPFCAELAKENSDYQHIEYVGCGTVSIMQSDIYNFLKGNYSGILSNGFDEEIIKQQQLSPEQHNKLVTRCLRNPAKFEISAINDEAIDLAGKDCGLTENQIKQLKDLQNANLLSKEEVEQMLENMNPQFKELLHTWNNSGLGRLQLTTVGIALAHANIKKTIDIDLDLGVWIK